MSTAPLERPGRLNPTLPPIDRLPAPYPGRSGPDAVGEFLAGTRGWSRVQVPLSPAVTGALWFVLVAATAVGGWSTAVLTGAAPCSGLPCTIATLGDHPELLLVLSGGGVLALAAAAALTHGLTRAGGPELAVIAVGALAGVISLLGVVAMLVLIAVALVFAVSVLALFVAHD